MSSETIAELVNRLFDTRRRPDGKEHTYMEITVALSGAIEPSHLSKLRSGKITNPGRDILLGLCRFFQVDPVYFFPELREKLADQPPPEDPLRVALRGRGLPIDICQKIEELVELLQSKKLTSK